ncbi:hypothetical protein H310_14921 [Aphanomyces invadans]|uniref:Uncharacterized protein n=1 Tax=Aphanomyces invadans TaxID=157072 RepID=A0A024TA61_9STRA|nr:hypothetical protein H310_14921 [Aphanomyces invadans]ETV90242.1 hypothetical protein H310_14921 [Aphanomyces invadans]|eukprot:XP_008881117.1 hypothetical protein H310_14921 [Aphanomyces invadans]
MSCALFTNPDLLATLKRNVTTTSERFLPTGIPPHVDLFKGIERNLAAIQTLPDLISDRLEGILDEHDVGSGNITRQYLETTLSNLVSQLHSSPNERVLSPPSTPGGQLYTWGGRLSKLPADFEFPAVDAATAWRLWWRGNVRSGHPPYRFIVPADLATTKQRKALSDWKFVMGHFERVSVGAGFALPTRPTDLEVSNMFEPVAGFLRSVYSCATGKRTRRITQLRLVSHIRVLRKHASTLSG